MKFLNIIFLPAMFLSLGVLGQSADKAPADTASDLQDVVVTATRASAGVLLTPYAVGRLGRKELDTYQFSTTPDALRAVNGVFVQKTSLGGGAPIVRGLMGNQTLILVDGIRLNNSTFRYGPNQYLNTIDSYTIDKIEVAKGTGSVQFGSDALGGVINVFSRAADYAADKPRFEARIIGKDGSGGMEKTIRTEATYGSRKFSLLAGINRRNFGQLIGGDTTGKQSPSGYQEWSMDIKAKIKLPKNMELTLANQFLRQEHVNVYYKLLLENYSLNEMDPQQRLLSYARLKMNPRSPLLKAVELTLSYQQGVEGRASLKYGSIIKRLERDKIGTVGLTGDVLSVFNPAWTANSGIEIYSDRVTSSRMDLNIITNAADLQRGLYPNNATYGNYSLYSLHHFRFSKWILDAGLRFNSFNIRLTDAALGKVNATPLALVGNGTLMYRLNAQHSVYAGLSSGFRAPNVDDMGSLGIVDFRYELPTLGLKPEKSRNTELGYKIRTKTLQAAVSVYYMQLSNLITRVRLNDQMINGYPVYKKENTESAFLKGFEAELNWKVAGRLSMGGAMAYTYGQNLSRREPLRRIPPFNGRLTGNYNGGKWFAAAECLLAAAQKRLAAADKADIRIAPGGTPGWKVVNFYGGYKFRVIHLSASLQNIGNADYRTHGSGINGVGRSLWLSLNFLL